VQDKDVVHLTGPPEAGEFQQRGTKARRHAGTKCALALLAMLVGLPGCSKLTKAELDAHREQIDAVVKGARDSGAEATGILETKLQPMGILEGLQGPLDVTGLAVVRLDPAKARMLDELVATLVHQRALIDRLTTAYLAPAKPVEVQPKLEPDRSDAE
jgi:hypothetical protein